MAASPAKANPIAVAGGAVAATEVSTTPYRRGATLVVLAACVLSLNGLVLRHIEDASAWQILFWRASALTVAMCCLFLVRHRGRAMAELRRAAPSALVAAPFAGLASVCFIQSLTHTTVANTLFTLSAVPLLTAVLGWLILKEPVSRATWLAIAAAMAGIALMVADGFGSGALFGNVMALATAALFACYVIALRRGRGVDMLPSVCIAGVIAASIGGIVADDLVLSPRDTALCLLWGAVLSCAGHALFTLGSRFVPAAEISLLSLTEFVLGPLWVWLVVDEVPGTLTLAGGAVVLVVIVAWSHNRMRRGRAASAVDGCPGDVREGRPASRA
ncbi:MAG: DMT family transporter [Alphaproteobacteria bacterium]